MTAIASKLKRKRTPYNTPEQCGFILKSGKLVSVKNVHPNPLAGFAMSASDLKKYEATARGTWHTHPGGPSTLSQDDYLGFSQWPALTHYIVGADSLRAYRIIDGFAQEVELDAV